MLEFHFDHCIPNVLVAVKTEFIASLKENKLIIRRMGVVAFYTIPIHHYFMAAFGILGHNSFVALNAYFVRIFAEQFSVGRGMRVMTLRTFSRLDGSMNK
jgi:hypothetical protein